MAMLADRKRREKWCLNPRGKAWSDDQNKFGQRLMEKMGWKAGEGLGAKSQGVTDIVKTKLKNDNKGLGFKENGEEWLKTTSDFDSLLDDLASSQGENGEKSQTEAPGSLEDRSKKSRARVHYHKFTRGKDLSRYSEKDLASIIGPDVIKVKSEQESTSDYTQNQVNKGSIEEYFNRKSMSKEKKSFDNVISNNICNVKEENVINSKSETLGLNSSSELLKTKLEPEAQGSIRKKKRKKGIDESEGKINNSEVDANHFEEGGITYNSETEVLSKKKKKRKIGHNLGDVLQEPDEKCSQKEGENEHNVETYEQGLTCRSKRKRKIADNLQDADFTVKIENSEGNLDSKDGTISNIKMCKVKDKQIVQSESNEEYDNTTIEFAEQSVLEEIKSKKKKKKSKVKDKDMENTEHPAEFIDNLFVIPEDPHISKKKKKKNKREELPEDSQKFTTQHVANSTNIISVNDEVRVDSTETVLKKKKKKSKQVENELQEEAVKDDPTVGKKKTKHPKKDQIKEENSETALGEEQVVSSNKAGEFIEVLGRRTRLKKIKTPLQTFTNDSYQTEEFMSLNQVFNSETAAHKKYVNQKSLTAKQQPVANEEIKANTNIAKLGDQSTKKGVDKKSTSTKSKNIEKNVISEDSNYVKCYGDPNSDDCNIPKHVVAYEYRLVSARLKRLEITQPNVKVVVKDSNTLNETTHRKLKQIGKIKQLKNLLPPNDIIEIEALVSKFYDSLKPKIEMMTIISELEDKISEIVKISEDNSETKENKDKVATIKNLWSEKVDSFTNSFEKLKTLVDSFEKTLDDSNSLQATNKESSVADDAADGNESSCLWLKKVKTKLDTLKEHMQMLSEGKKPPCLNTSLQTQNTAKKNKRQFIKPDAHVKKNSYQDTSYSRGRIAHNVRNQRGRGREVGRGQGTQNAVPYGGWGILKSYQRGEQELPTESQSFRGGFDESGHMERGSYTWQARGLNSRGVMGRGRGDFSRQGRGEFSSHGRGSFTGRGRGDFRGRGRGDFRGYGRADMRGRGRISQNNFDAKVYAEKCKELNKVPDICFNGINLKVISGYPASGNTDKPSTPIKIE